MPRSTPATQETSKGEESPADPLRDLQVEHTGLPWKRMIGSFVLVLGVYWTYALAVVPFIEPTIVPHADFGDSAPGAVSGENVVKLQHQALAPWFSPGDWELTSPKVFESPRGKLLVRTYETLPDGRLQICPCTIIFLAEGEAASQEERNRRAVILQAPEGAILRFDTPVDLKQGKIGKLVGGTMMGPIKIRSDQRLPGPQDDLLITTRDAELIGDRIVTSHPVDFRMGPNQGNGRDMEIHLAPSTTSSPGSPAPGFGGVNSLTLKYDVRMRLYPGQADMFPNPSAPPAAAAAQRPAEDPRAVHDNPPVDITCDGAFQFDVTRHAATFRKHVDVMRANLEGPSDQMTCELLSVFFEPAGSTPAATPGATAPVGGTSKLEPSRIEAEGEPVVIRSPSRGVQARGTRLEYDLKKNAGGLQGPGWLNAVRPGDARAQPVEATWRDRMKFGPLEGVQCAELEGDAHVESRGVGLLNAQTIQLFLVEDPTPPANPTDRRRLVPDRLQAYKQVHFDSPTLSGDVSHLQVWIKRPPPMTPAAQLAAQSATAPPGAPAAGPPSPFGASAGAGPQTAPQRHLHVAGKLLQVEALMGEKTTDVTRIHIERDVRLRETQSAEPGARPMTVKGDQLDVDQPLPNQAVVHVLGKPARIEAREMMIEGAAIHLDRARNYAWVDGQGLMTVLMPADPKIQPPPPARPLRIEWKRRMDFDGRDATFFDSVVTRMEQQKITSEGVATFEQQRLTSDWLQAVFEPRVLFDQMDPRARPQISHVLCRGNVFLEQRTTAGEKPLSVERLTAADLRAEPASGNLLANGPGWVRRVWLDTGNGIRAPGTSAAAKPAASRPPGNQLAYLGVYFQGRLLGNQTRQTMDFRERVRTVYGPVPDWDTILEPDDPDKLGDGAILLTSDRLQVERMAPEPGHEQPFELIATGSAKIDGRANFAPGGTTPQDPTRPPSKGQMFSASAARVSYAATKDLLVMEGDGRSDAHLARQVRIGAPYDEQTAGKFLFWPSLNKLLVQDAQQLNIQTLDSGTPNRRPPPPSARGNGNRAEAPVTSPRR
jgi:hypothetical protein